mmetsp:Transcript_6603/g.14365  ORF Transcript_6603/g.14365 Transcript_6603/m.14365 type:complete len:129 (-) Transcript_6603:437-823(-)
MSVLSSAGGSMVDVRLHSPRSLARHSLSNSASGSFNFAVSHAERGCRRFTQGPSLENELCERIPGKALTEAELPKDKVDLFAVGARCRFTLVADLDIVSLSAVDMVLDRTCGLAGTTTSLLSTEIVDA